MFRLFNYITKFKVVRFVISGGIAASVTIATVFILTDVYTVWYLVATAVGFILAVGVNFLLQKFWTFRDKTLKSAHKQSAGFFVVNGINFFLNGALMVLFVEYFGLWPVFAQVCAAALIAVVSFIAYSFIFRSPKKVTSESLSGDDNIVHT